MDRPLLVALEEGGVKNCGVIDLLIFFEVLYLLAVGGKNGSSGSPFLVSAWSLCVMSGFECLSLDTIHFTVEVLPSTAVLLET